MKLSPDLIIAIGMMVLVCVFAGCLYGESRSPYAGNFTITHIEQNDGTYWKYPSTYSYTLNVLMGDGKSATVYASPYFVNRHPEGVVFDDSTMSIKEYNDRQILIFSSDTPNELRDKYPQTQSADGCPVGYTGNVIRVAYVEDYHEIPMTGAHYWAYYDPDGSSASHLTLAQLMKHINESGDKYRIDCIYPSYQIHDYWENDAGPMGGYDGEKLTTALPRMATMEVNFADNTSAPSTEPLKTKVAPPLPTGGSDNGYGCPGCPENFMGFARDMCSRFGSNFTVSDDVNTIKCSELEGEL